MRSLEETQKSTPANASTGKGRGRLIPHRPAAHVFNAFEVRRSASLTVPEPR